jgi:hypothetical protein
VVALALEDRTARLMILIDPLQEEAVRVLCTEEDATPSSVVPWLIRRYIEERSGPPWSPADADDAPRLSINSRARRCRLSTGLR